MASAISVNIDSDGDCYVKHQASMCSNADLLSTEPYWINFSERWLKK